MPEHSDVQLDKPGKCPHCGMTLIPVMEVVAKTRSAAQRVERATTLTLYTCPMEAHNFVTDKPGQMSQVRNGPRAHEHCAFRQSHGGEMAQETSTLSVMTKSSPGHSPLASTLPPAEGEREQQLLVFGSPDDQRAVSREILVRRDAILPRRFLAGRGEGRGEVRVCHFGRRPFAPSLLTLTLSPLRGEGTAIGCANREPDTEPSPAN